MLLHFTIFVMSMRFVCSLLILMALCLAAHAQGVYELEKGKISFHSDAPQELISASSDHVKGAVDVRNKSFAFKISMVSFMGFNSPLQREHFNENYMESSLFPDASFSGKIIEDLDFSKDGVYTVRAKGKLVIHGIAKERIIKTQVSVKSGIMHIESDFVVPLADHNIKVPRVVSEKLASDISVSIKATLKPLK